MHHTTIGFRRRVPWLLLALALLLGACSSGGDSGQASTSNTADTSDIDRDGVVRMGWDLVQSQGNNTLDPAKASVAVPLNEPLWFAIWGRLMRPTPDGDLVPELAQDVTLVDDQTIDITLRPNLTWHDGSAFDAAAVKTGLERTRDTGSTGALDKSFFALEAIDVTSPTELTLRFPSGTAASWLSSYLGSWETTIVKPDTDYTKPIGAGPMKVASIVADQKMVLERFDGYWNADAVNFARMELNQIASTQAATSGIPALQSGQFDFTRSDVAVHDTLTGNIAPVTVPDPNALGALQLCKRDGPLADARVRVAMSKAIDREALSEAVYVGTAEPALMLWPEGHPYYSPEFADALTYDKDQAQQLLTEAGYSDGFTVDLYPNVNLKTSAEVIKAQLAEVGITVNIVPITNYLSEYLQPQKAGMGLSPGGSVGLQKLAQWYGDSLGNVCKYNDPVMASVADGLLKVSDKSDEAVELWRQVNEQFTEQALSVPLVFAARLAAYRSDLMHVEDIWPKGQPFPDIYTAYMKAN